MSCDNEIVSILQKWLMEAYNPRNDGWVQEHYRVKVAEVVEYLGQNKDRISKKAAPKKALEEPKELP